MEKYLRIRISYKRITRTARNSSRVIYLAT